QYRLDLSWGPGNNTKHFRGSALLLQRLLQPVLEQRNSVEYLNGATLASSRRRIAALQRPLTSPLNCFAGPSHALTPLERRRNPSYQPEAVLSKGGTDPTDVRFGSKADICGATEHFRFTPNSHRESGLP